MVDFAGWHMPVQYRGVIEEHLAVRTAAGLFDVSHMGEVRVRGNDALRYLQHVTCNDVSRLLPGRIQYSGLMLPNGAFVDDLLVHKIADGEYFLVINAGNTAKDVAWLEQHARGFDVEVAHESESWGQLALQGPRAEAILAPLTPLEGTPGGIERRSAPVDARRIEIQRAESLLASRLADLPGAGVPREPSVGLAEGGITVPVPWGGFVPEDRKDRVWRKERCAGGDADSAARTTASRIDRNAIG